MKIYIAGPIKGKPNRNEEEFRRAQAYLEDQKYQVIVPLDINPYTHDGDCPGNTSNAGESNEHKSGCFMREDIKAMLGCDAIFLLDGWENSAGAKVEFITAQACGLEIWYERYYL